MIWTTTPWTLPSNLAVAVRPDIDYVVVESTTRASATAGRGPAGRVRPGAGDRTGNRRRVVQRLKGAELVGRSYTPPFSYFLGHAGAHRVLAADFVTTEEGTGLVHLAPAFGEEDKLVSDARWDRRRGAGRPGRQVHRPRCRTTQGMHVFDANLLIIDDLKAVTRGRVGGSVTAGHRAAAPGDLRPPLPALLALQEPADLQGGLQLVRRGDQGQGPDG